jgi:U3 small nucleolar RNA-associated protein 15
MRLWDLTAGIQISLMDDHMDYVHFICRVRVGYDVGYGVPTIHVWVGRRQTASMTLQHGTPVESVAFFPSGNVCVAGRGERVCMGRCRRRPAAVDEPQKTVTAVSVVDVTDIGGVELNAVGADGRSI